MARAFKVPVPKSYSNVTEAKLVQKGSNVWVQLPANLVTDRKMCRKSVYMDDYNSRTFHNHKYKHVKPKVITRRSSYQDFMYPQDHLVPGYIDMNTKGLTTRSDLNLKTRKNFGEPSNSFYEGMSRGKYYEGMKQKRSPTIHAYLPVMRGDYGLDDHYAIGGLPSYERKSSTLRSYNEKARDALPGAGGGNAESSFAIDSLVGDNFPENPLKKPDLLNYEIKRSVSVPPPRSNARSKLNFCHSGNYEPYTSLDDSVKRYELETLTKIRANEVQPSLDHLYKPSGCIKSSGYKVISPAYEHGNSTFFHTSSDTRGSFVVAPDWMSERKRSVVVRH